MKFLSGFGPCHPIEFAVVWKAIKVDWLSKGLAKFTLEYYEPQYIEQYNGWRVGCLGPMTCITDCSLEARQKVFSSLNKLKDPVAKADNIFNTILPELEQLLTERPPSKYPKLLPLDKRCIASKLAHNLWGLT